MKTFRQLPSALDQTRRTQLLMVGGNRDHRWNVRPLNANTSVSGARVEKHSCRLQHELL
jgi:hypothetical protein